MSNQTCLLILRIFNISFGIFWAGATIEMDKTKMK
jgi:hypothetical protein